MARTAKTKRSGPEMPTTPFVNLGGRDVPTKDLTASQLALWRELRETEREPNIWASASPCMPIPAH